MNIKEEILDYINCNEITGALLLTGPWGCGKSYLIKKIARELNENKQAAIAVISLFGLDSVSAINKRVKDEYTSFKLGSMGRSIKKISKRVKALAKDSVAVAKAAAPGNVALSAASKGVSSLLSYDILDFLEIQNTIGKKENERKFVIVFDDLERSNIPHKDLLGTINEFVENKQVKTIIVADENKITDNEETDNEYKEYKEKLISRTLRMTTDYDQLIENLVETYPETSNGYGKFLNKNCDLLKLVFSESESYNIRTLKCILADFERVYAVWQETGVTTDNMKWALYTFGAEMFLSKEPPKEDSQKDDIFSFSHEEKIQFQYKSRYNSDFSAFRNWIYKGIWNKNDFVAELKNKYVDEKKSPLYRFLMYRFWDLQQEDIDKGLPEAVSLAYNGTLSRDDLISLIGKIHALKVNSINLPCSIDYQRMEEGLKKRLENIKNGEITEPKSYTFIEKKNIDEDALNLLLLIENFDNKLMSFERRTLYLKFLSGDETESRYSYKGNYFDEFDSELLELFKEKYLNACNSDKRDYALSLMDLVFDNSSFSSEENMKTTKENFKNLIDWLEFLKSNDVITNLINKSFARELQNKYFSKNERNSEALH